MTISQISPRPEVILESPTGLDGLQPDQQDVQWFAAEMQPQAFEHSPDKGSVTGNLMEQLAASFGRIDKKSDKVAKVLSETANSTNPIDLTRVSSTLSSYYLESLMNAKVISKTVQGLEKLTNLQ